MSPKLVALRPMKVTATEVAAVQDVGEVEVGRVEVASVVVEVPVQIPLPESDDVG